jgi:hypothetical protein
MAEMLHEYRTDDGVKILCEDCARERKQARRRCEWHRVPTHAEQTRLACGDCGATVRNLPRPEPPDLDTLMRWMHDDGGCEAACPYGCWVEADGRCPHGKPSWLIVMGLI